MAQHVRVIFGVAGFAQEQIGVIVVCSTTQASRSEGFFLATGCCLVVIVIVVFVSVFVLRYLDCLCRLGSDGFRSKLQFSFFFEIPEDFLSIAFPEKGSILACHDCACPKTVRRRRRLSSGNLPSPPFSFTICVFGLERGNNNLRVDVDCDRVPSRFECRIDGYYFGLATKELDQLRASTQLADFLAQK